MPQIFQVLRCYKCLIFQIHQTKKSNKWECKLCGEKQSIKRHYGIGTGKECRLHVQKLNMMQSDKYEAPEMSDDDISDESDITESQKTAPPAKISKWSHFIDDNDIKEQQISFDSSRKECKNVDEKNVYVEYKKKSPVLESPKCILIKKHESNENSSWSNYTDSNNINDCVDVSINKNSTITLHNKTVTKTMSEKEIVLGPSRWNSYLDNEGIHSLNTNYTIPTKNSHFVELAATEQNDYKRNKTNEYIQNSKPQNKNFKQSLFSLSEDQDIDSILEVI